MSYSQFERSLPKQRGSLSRGSAWTNRAKHNREYLCDYLASVVHLNSLTTSIRKALATRKKRCLCLCANLTDIRFGLAQYFKRDTPLMESLKQPWTKRVLDHSMTCSQITSVECSVPTCYKAIDSMSGIAVMYGQWHLARTN